MDTYPGFVFVFRPVKIIVNRLLSKQQNLLSISFGAQAKKNGASSVEIDLEMTKDGVAVLLHNATVDATTDGSGAIKDMTYAEVRKLNAAAKFRG